MPYSPIALLNGWSVPGGVLTSPNGATLTDAAGALSIASAAGKDLTLAPGSGNQNVRINPTGTGSLIVGGGSPLSDNLCLQLTSPGGNTAGVSFNNASSGSGTQDTAGIQLNNASSFQFFTNASIPIRFVVNSGEKVRISTGGNLLVGTTTDSANGIIQIASSILAAGGIGFGTDTQLYRAGTATLQTNGSFTVGGNFVGPNGVQYQNGSGSEAYVPNGANSTIKSNGSTFVTFDGANSLMTVVGAIKTSAPVGGTAGSWKHGILVTAAVTADLTKYVQLDIGGTLYKLLTAA